MFDIKDCPNSQLCYKAVLAGGKVTILPLQEANIVDKLNLLAKTFYTIVMIGNFQLDKLNSSLYKSRFKL